MKKCTICKSDKPLSDFNKKSSTKDGLQTQCRDCSRERMRAYYNSNKDYHRSQVTARNKRYVAEVRDWIFEYLSSHPCVDCGNSDIRVLEFDHVRGEKSAHVSTLISSACSRKRIEAEIAKCEVRCRNCHQIVTFERMGGSWREKKLKTLE